MPVTVALEPRTVVVMVRDLVASTVSNTLKEGVKDSVLVPVPVSVSVTGTVLVKRIWV